MHNRPVVFADLTDDQVAEAIYYALDSDADSDGYMGLFELGAPIVIDGRFNLVSVARRLRNILGTAASKPDKAP